MISTESEKSFSGSEEYFLFDNLTFTANDFFYNEIKYTNFKSYGLGIFFF